MGFIAPIIAGIASAAGAGLTALGTAATAGVATGTAATVVGGLSAASTAAGIASTASSLAAGKPKMPDIPPPTQAQTPPTIASPTSPLGKSRSGGSLAQLSPGLALGGTGGLLGSFTGGAKKTLLGQ